MFGKNALLTTLESRKRLLVAESELNRAQLAEEVDELVTDVRALTTRAKSVATIVSSVAGLVTGLTALRRKKQAEATEKPPWWRTLLKGAGVVSTLWMAFRSQSRNQDDN